MSRRRRKRRKYYSSRRRRSDVRFEPVGLDLSPETKRGIAIIAFLAAAVVSALGIFNLAGNFGELITRLLGMLFGSLAFFTPLIFFGVALSLFLGGRIFQKQSNSNLEKSASLLRTYLGATLFVLAVTGILHLFAIQASNQTAFELVKLGEGGGYLGVFTSFPLYSLMGFGASLVVLTALTVIAFLVAFNLSLHSLFRAVIALFRFGSSPAEQRKPEAAGKESPPLKINTMQSAGFAVNSVDSKKSAPKEVKEDSLLPSEKEARQAEPAEESITEGEGVLGQETAESAAAVGTPPEKFRKGAWQLPPLDLLEETDAKVESGNIEANAKIIEKTLEDFGVSVEMGEVYVGPTVTQYTFRPAVGVKLSQILALRSDLALALAAPSLRIEAPIPGKSLVGVEVPNKTAALVRLKDLLQSEVFVNHPSTLAFALGRDVAGHPMVADLGKMPHLLIAGATGTGKSVCINTIMTSFLFRNSPEELRVIMIDPKRVELTLYNGIPHLLTPVVTDHKQAVNALKWMVAEMDHRYQVLSEAGKRNIDEYNKNGNERMPYIVLIVDELADLMSVAMRDVEASIVRLAQMARAVGLHLILATQRPSVNIITGLIKANITSRIAFAVASQVDSRTILDMAGAENLLGNGDMLYTAANLPKPKRIQAPFVSEQEVKKVVEFLKEQSGPVEYQTEILEKTKATSGLNGADGEEADDEMIAAAIEEIKRARKASATLLQRRLKVGYSRAARILDVLEERGLIGPAEGAKPREVYIEE